MAALTFNQPTDMAALPTSFAGTGLGTATEIEKYDTAAAYIQVIYQGIFQYDAGAFYGTITRAYIDNADFGLLPNIEITGLDFQFNTGFYSSTLQSGNLLGAVTSLLAGNDTLIGTSGADGMLGFDGDDTFLGGAGGDAMNGGTGINTASYANAAAGVVAGLADPATNTGDAVGDSYVAIQNLTGSRFNDRLVGNAGSNVLDGGVGNDVLAGGGSFDILRGGLGNDIYVLANDGDSVVDIGGIDIVTSTATRSLLAAGLTVIENLTLLGTANIAGTGNTLANVISGNAGANVLRGGFGNDVLRGFNGNDQLFGEIGRDTLTGGFGADLFRFAVAAHSVGATMDVITDFDDFNNDRIDLSTVFGGVLAYRHNLAFTAAGQVRINDVAGADVLVEVNTGGSLAADMQIRLTATSLASMAANDFFL